MTETYHTTQSRSTLSKKQITSCQKECSEKPILKHSSSSSSLNSSFGNLNTEIKTIIENELDLSFSSESNSESEENKENMDYLFSHKIWQESKNSSLSQKDKDSTEKRSISGKTEIKKQVPIPLKCGNSQSIVGISEGSNKQSTQSNEDEEPRFDHIQNVSSCESNNNSSMHNESEENEKEKEKKKEEEKIKENKDKKLKEINLNNNNNTQNMKFNNKMNESDFIYPYDSMNYKNHNLPFFQSMYLHPQLYPFIPGYNYPTLNKKNFITNHNNNFNNNKLEENNPPDKEKIEGNNNININNINTQNQYQNHFMNNINNFNNKINQNQMDMIDLPLVMNNTHANPMNYRYQKLNFNMLCCPQIQPVNVPVQKQTLDKANNSSNFLPEINNKETTQTSNSEKKNKNNSNITNNNVCPIIGKGNNEIKINNKNFVMNKTNNVSNKGNLKGEKQFLNLDDIVTGKDTRTTVMIRNIPIKYTDQILNDDLKEFNGKYDCLYMPYDYEKNGNKGYAFINFVNPLHILYFYEKFNGKKWQHFESNKICELNCAHFQGINEIQKHAKNYKGQKKPNYYSRNANENIIIPSKYLLKIKHRFPKMKYTENKVQKIITVKSFE